MARSISTFGGSTPDPKTAGALRRRAGFCSPPRRNADFLAGRDRLRHVYHGDNGETLNNDFSPCCGYYESLAVESSGRRSWPSGRRHRSAQRRDASVRQEGRGHERQRTCAAEGFKRHARVRVTKAGYVGASFRAP
jgi:hypothetical protein